MPFRMVKRSPMQPGRWIREGSVVLAALLIGGLTACKGEAPLQPTKVVKKEKITSPPVQIPQVKSPLPEITAPSPQPTAATTPPPPGGETPTADTTPPPIAPPPSVPFTPQPVKALTQLHIVLDASGSMSGQMEAETKMGLTRTVIKDLLTQPSPPESKRHLGLRLFGSQSPADANRCDDTILLIPPGPIEAERFSRQIEDVSPQGTSPLAKALEAAAADFPQLPESDQVILLIADGGDTCNADPCTVAERIHAGPAKVVIHVVGFDLDPKAQEQLRCVASKGDGQFFLARNGTELRTAIDQAANANLPYNLRLKVLTGATPLPTQVTVLKAGTEQVVQKGMTAGIKFFQLPPGSYDILIEYLNTIETPKPAKTLKGVEVQTTTRAEQIVQFDLGQLQLLTVDPDSRPAKASYELRKVGGPTPLGTFEAGPEAKRIALSPGKYEVAVSGLSAGGVPLTSRVTDLEIKSGEVKEQTFKFATGTLVLRAQAGPDEFVAAGYQITAPAAPATVLLSGEVPADGGPIVVPAGSYNCTVQPIDPLMKGLGPVTITDVTIDPQATVQQLVGFTRGAATLSGKDIGKDGKGVSAKTEFQIRKPGATDPVTTIVADAGPVTVALAPGTYDILALNVGANVTPAPSILWTGIGIEEGKTIAQEANFQLGGLKVTAKNARGLQVPAVLTVFRAGTEEQLGSVRADPGGSTFRLTPGLYDVRAEDGTATTDPKPTVWLRDIPVAGNIDTDREVTFTAGKIKLACRGANNKVLACEFRLFAYGTDRPLFTGTTGETWQEFTIDPGHYYLEAGYHDPLAEQLLKKWITVAVAENAIVEQTIRF